MPVKFVSANTSHTFFGNCKTTKRRIFLFSPHLRLKQQIKATFHSEMGIIFLPYRLIQKEAMCIHLREVAEQQQIDESIHQVAVPLRSHCEWDYHWSVLLDGGWRCHRFITTDTMTQSTASWETIMLANEINGFAVLKCHSMLGLLVVGRSFRSVH